MGIEEIILSLLLSLLSNGITTLADRYDKGKKQEFEELRKQLKESNILEAITIESLKSIEVNSKEVDQLKVLVADDVFKNKLADIVKNETSENDIKKLIISEVKEHCNFPEDKVLTIEPHINQFVNEFYKKVLQNPTLSPFLIVKRIDESIITSQSEHKELKELTLKGFEEIKNQLAESRDIPSQSLDAGQPIPSDVPISTLQEETRATRYFHNEFEKILITLNKHFKSRADDIKQIQKNRDFKKAIELYETLLNEADEKIDEETILGIYADCALCSINLDELESAQKWLERAESIAPNDKRVLAIRGLYFYEVGDMAKCGEYAEKSLALDPRYHLALILITGVSLESGLDGKSVVNTYFFDGNNLKDGFKQDHLAVIYRTIGQCYLKDNAYDEAIDYFEKSLTLDPLDNATLSLIGFSLMTKAIGANKQIIHFHENLTSEKETMVKTAIDYFNKSLELAARNKNIKSHVTTRANLSLCHMLLGEYDKAYNVTDISNTSLTEYETLLKSRAAAAYHKGSFTEAADLLSKVHDVTCQDAINEAIAILLSSKGNKGKEALDVIDNFLQKKTINQDDMAQINYLKLEILLSLKDKDGGIKVLRAIETSSLPEWQKDVARGNFYETFGDYEKADKHYKTSLKYSDIVIPSKIFIAHYFFQKDDFETCFDICSSIPINSIKTNIEIFQRLLHMTVVSSFKLSKFEDCQKFITYGKQQKIEAIYLNEISAAIHWQEDALEKARNELTIALDKVDKSKKMSILSNLGLVSLLLGDFKSATNYYAQVEKKIGFYDDSSNAINCIVAFTVIGNKLEANRIFKKAIETKFEDKDDIIHKFAPTFYLRENNSDLFAKYIVEFNNRHGDTAWLWKKDIKRDEEELRTIFSEIIREASVAKKSYLENPLPLIFLPLLVRKKEIIHLWRFNREYGLPLFLESGNPKEIDYEISLLTGRKSILVDYTSLLALQEAGTEYLWLLDKIFDEIIIYRPMFLHMLNEMVSEEHEGLRAILTFISDTKKIKFLPRVKTNPKDYQDKDLYNLIPEAYHGFFKIAKEKRVPLLVGESRLRGLAINSGISSCGVRAFFEYAKNIKVIEEQEISRAIINFIKKDAQFISFNRETIDYLHKYYLEKEFKTEFDKFSNQIFLPHSELGTFANVYLGFISKFITTSVFDSKIKYLIEKTISDVKKLTSRALALKIFPSLYKNNLTSMNKINLICLGYLFQLLRIIYSSKISDKLKNKYIDIVEQNANLAYWYENQFQGVPLIQFIFESAKAAADKKQ